MKRIDHTEEHFNIFCFWCQQWKNTLGLNDWCVTVALSETHETWQATTSFECKTKVATVYLNKSYQDCKCVGVVGTLQVCDLYDSLALLAFHEIQHLNIADMHHLAIKLTNAYYMEDYIDSVAESYCMRQENTIFELLYNQIKNRKEVVNTIIGIKSKNNC